LGVLSRDRLGGESDDFGATFSSQNRRIGWRFGLAVGFSPDLDALSGSGVSMSRNRRILDVFTQPWLGPFSSAGGVKLLCSRLSYGFARG
jgi:hypothetical protein